MNIYAINTLSDWFFSFGTTQAQGLQRMCHLLAEAGVSRFYMRTHEGGVATYPSQVCRVLVGEEAFKEAGGFASYPKSYFNYVRALDYTRWDPVELLPEAAQSAGIEHAYWYTILEDDHGGSRKSSFLKEHPELRCVRRDGTAIDGCLDFWFQETRDYKRRIVEELISKGARHFLLDLLRRNGKPSADAQGHYHYGFNPEIREAFKKKTSKDPIDLEPGSPEWPEWLGFSGGPLCDFIIEIAQLIREAGGVVELLVWPVDLQSWLGIDLRKIVASGLIDAIHVGSNAYSYSPGDIARQLAALKPQVEGSSVRIIPSISGYNGLTPEGLDAAFAALEAHRCPSVVVHEGDSLIESRTMERFRAMALGVPHFRRSVTAPFQQAIDWNKAPVFKGFVRGYNEKCLEPDQETSFQVAHDGTTLEFRVTCKERDCASLLPVPRWPADNYNVLKLGARAFWNPQESLHLFLTTPGRAGDYFHFVLDPAGGRLQERYLDEKWEGDWTSEVKIEDGEWVARFRLPLASLESLGASRLGFHLVRAQAKPMQISMWTPATGGAPRPMEFASLTLLAKE